MKTRAERRAQVRAYERERTARMIAAGLCYRCGGPLDDGDRKLCAACVGKISAYHRELREWRKMSGACIFCGRIARENRLLCERCAEKQRISAKNRREKKAHEDRT